MTQKIKNGVAIVPIYKGRIALLKQIRNPYKKPFLNIVMGGVKDNTSTIKNAKRECSEEIGLIPKKLLKIGKIIQLPGSENIETTIFYSEFQEKPMIPKNITEPILDINFYSKKEIKEMIKKNKITESTTVLALLLVLKYK